MEVNNLSDAVEGSNLKNRFYGESEVVYRERAASEARPKDDAIRGLWRDRLFDRQTELLQKHVEFSQRQQTELCEAIKAAWTAKEAEVTLDRDVLLKILEAKTVESTQQTKTILDKLHSHHHTLTATLEIDTAIQPVKSELKALQFQLQRLVEKQLLDNSASSHPYPGASSYGGALPYPGATTDRSFYAKMRAEVSDISAELANCVWTVRKPKKLQDTKPPENFVLRIFGDVQASPKRQAAPKRLSAIPPSPSVGRRSPLPLVKAQSTGVTASSTLKRQTPASRQPVRVSPEKPRDPPKELTPSPAVKKEGMRFDMQTNTDDVQGGFPKRNPRDYLAIDDLFIDIPGNFTPVVGATRPALHADVGALRVVTQPLKTVLERDERKKALQIAGALNNFTLSPSPVLVMDAQGKDKEDVSCSSASDGRSVGEVSLSSGQISGTNSVSYW